MKYCFLIIALLVSTAAFSQKEPDKTLVQFSGIVVTTDSLKPVPFTSVIIKNTYRGTVSDVYGFFSFVARMKDTIEFSAIGFKKAVFVVPDTITDFRCSLIQMLFADTIQLRTAVIYPWPTKEQFKEAFLSLRVPQDDIDRANRNLDRNKLNTIGSSMAMDGSMNFRNQMQEHQSRLYYAGQVPTSNWLNPIAWAKFIQAWQNGEFKK